MKSWDLVISEEAQKDITLIYDYIADVLCESALALNQVTRISDAISALRQMPERFPVCDRNLRRQNAGHYAVFYQVLHQERLVAIVAVMHSGRDIGRVLENQKSLRAKNCLAAVFVCSLFY